MSKKPCLLRIAAAALAVAAAGTAGAADERAAFERAVGHIQSFPGRTMHGADHGYALRGVVTDDDGAEHVRVERRYKGLRVIGGDVVVHSNRAGAFIDASRTLAQPLALDVKARLTHGQVAAAAARHGGTLAGAPELVVYARGAQPQLAFLTHVHGEQADGTPAELNVVVDAATGAELDRWDDIHTLPATGTGRTLFSGNVTLNTETAIGGFTLTDSTRGGMRTLNMRNRTNGGTAFTDADNTWGNNATSDTATVAADAHFGAAMTWDYYKTVHGRNGIANNGVGASSRVHYGRNYANAFWSDSCFCMTYGDGNGTTVRPLVALDVAGHEMSHGVTSRTAGLIYSGESGGLNEATSDIFGTMVEFYAANTNDAPDYLIGEKLFTNGTSVIRNMMRPSVDGASADCWYSGVGALDVHYSSGVANHFYFLLAEGTSAGQPSPTCVAGNTRVATGAGSLTGIGRSAAEKIWYRALTVYMTSGTTYAQARAATIRAAGDLFGAGSPEAGAVAAAWTAVNVN